MKAVNCATNELNRARMMLILDSKLVAPFQQRKIMYAVTCSRTKHFKPVEINNSDSLNVQFIWL